MTVVHFSSDWFDGVIHHGRLGGFNQSKVQRRRSLLKPSVPLTADNGEREGKVGGRRKRETNAPELPPNFFVASWAAKQNPKNWARLCPTDLETLWHGLLVAFLN